MLDTKMGTTDEKAFQTTPPSAEEKHKQNAQNSPLLKLPAELRNKVYRSILIADDEININMRDIQAYTRILNVCTQIRTEASEIFYGENTFRITDAERQQPDTASFLQEAGIQNIAKISTLTVDLALPKWESKARAVAEFLEENNHEAAAQDLRGYIRCTPMDAARELGLFVVQAGVSVGNIAVQKPRRGANSMTIEDMNLWCVAFSFEQGLTSWMIDAGFEDDEDRGGLTEI